MTHAVKTSLERIVARRNGAAWREHLVGGSVDSMGSEVPLVWSRSWLHRRFRTLVPTANQPANGE
jgi:hypothetical protein